ncbi:hypothetical protein [Myxosarcina sp. GI1(2024)]
MYRKSNQPELIPENFELPVAVQLSPDNRWVRVQIRKKNEESEVEETQNKGKLILDATAAPAEITYPSDLGILNQSRIQTEKIIDSLYKDCEYNSTSFLAQSKLGFFLELFIIKANDKRYLLTEKIIFQIN